MTFTMAVQQLRELAADDITDNVANYVDLNRSGRGMKGLCPFHDEKTPSFHVSEQRGIYKCFGCGLGGDAIDFVMRMEGKEFHEVIFQLAAIPDDLTRSIYLAENSNLMQLTNEVDT